MGPISTDTAETLAIKRQINIASVGTAVPPQTYSQAEILNCLLSQNLLKTSTQSLYRRVMSHPSIEKRHFALTNLTDAFEQDTDKIQARFEIEGTKLASEALSKAILASGIRPVDLDFLVVATCTGYLCPGLASRLVEANKLNPRIHPVDLVGMGCGGALPALHQAFNFLKANPGSTAAVVCVEICSAAFFSNDEPGIVISNSLFSDGAAALILNSKTEQSTDGSHLPAPTLHHFESLMNPAWREELRFKSEKGRLKNSLGPNVPAYSAASLKNILPSLLASQGLSRKDIRHWMIHPGGEKVLTAIKNELQLSDQEITNSREVLRQHGNMSSASVLFVLEETLRTSAPRPREWGILASFGAGFSTYAALVRF